MLFGLCRDGQGADAAACAVSLFFLSATALKKLYLSRNWRGDLPSQTVGSDPACHMCVGIKVCKLTSDVPGHTRTEKGFNVFKILLKNRWR